MKNALLEALISYFPVGAAESERHLLERVYVRGEDFADLLTAPPGSPRLLVGKKGTGKSAILQYGSVLLKALSIPYLHLRPMDLNLQGFTSNAAVGDLTRVAYHALLGAVAAELGSQQSGLIGRDAKVLYDQAVKEGLIRQDAIGAAARLLPQLAQPLIKVDLSKVLSDTAATAIQLQRGIAATLSNESRNFYLFFDDTDHLASPTIPDQLNRIWAFLLASREITQKIDGLRMVVTLREEIWRRLTRDKAGQRDQADHFLPLVRELVPTRDHVRAVVLRRLDLAAKALNLDGISSPWNAFFEGLDARMPRSEERRSWEDLIILRSRERPRDAIQLVEALARRAIGNGNPRISEIDFHQTMPEFSARRVFLLAQEVESECPQVREVVQSL